MKYRYTGSGFYIDAKAGEIPSDTLKRLLEEQPNTDRPSKQQLLAQVRHVHAIEDMRAVEDVEAMRQILVRVLIDLARSIHSLEPME